MFKECLPEWMETNVLESLEETSYMFNLSPGKITVPTEQNYQEMEDVYLNAHLLNNPEYLTELTNPKFNYIKPYSNHGAIIGIKDKQNKESKESYLTLDKLTSVERIFENKPVGEWKQRFKTKVQADQLWYLSENEPLAVLSTFFYIEEAEDVLYQRS